MQRKDDPGANSVPRLVLRPLRQDDEAQARAAHEELLADNFYFLLFFEAHPLSRMGDWSSYVRRTESLRAGEDLPDGLVPSTFLVAEVDEHIVGRVSVRHALTPSLERWGGHIGYAVRPAFRCYGYATEMLARSLLVAAATGLRKVLLTCDVDNVASARVIEKCGGSFERLEPAQGEEAAKRRYWIDLTG